MAISNSILYFVSFVTLLHLIQLLALFPELHYIIQLHNPQKVSLHRSSAFVNLGLLAYVTDPVVNQLDHVGAEFCHRPIYLGVDSFLNYS